MTARVFYWYVYVDMCSAVKVVLQGALRIEGATMEKVRANKLPLWVPCPAWLGTYRGVVPAFLDSKAHQGFGNLALDRCGKPKFVLELWGAFDCLSGQA